MEKCIIFDIEDQSLSRSLKKDATRSEEFQFTLPPLDMEIITEILLMETDFLLDEKVTKGSLLYLIRLVRHVKE